MKTLGLIAGSGALPISLARHCRSIGRSVYVLRLAGFAHPDLAAFDGCDIGLAELGRAFSTLRSAGCRAVCFAGGVARPTLGDLKPDFRGAVALPGAIAAAKQGDDGLLTYLLRQFEQEGFEVEGAHDVMSDLLLPIGLLGRVDSSPENSLDIDRALIAARTIGALDIGQGAVCCDGLVLALEAQEGTDAMLQRVAALPQTLRGDTARRRGVLAKVCKPMQETRIDLPTVGPTTVRNAAAAGLAGVVGEAGLILVLEREAVAALADELGLFVLGVAPPR